MAGGAAVASQLADAIAVSFPTPAIHRAGCSGEGGRKRGEAPDVLGVGHLAEDGKLAVQRAEVRGKVAAVAELGGNGQRSFLAAAADDDRDPCHRPGVASGFRQPDPVAAVRLGAGLPQRAKRLDGRLQLGSVSAPAVTCGG
jgi:hypothetical protein